MVFNSFSKFIFAALFVISLSGCGRFTRTDVANPTDVTDANTTQPLGTTGPDGPGPDSSPRPIPVPDGLEATASQTEGPYYPVEFPSETDNNLTRLDNGETAAGQIVELNGVLLTSDGVRLAGHTIEIWQTDNKGIYLHPDDPELENRDTNFQSFGRTVTSGSGEYSFRTLLPGVYEDRPAHIHLKVFDEDVELLTSQIYFDNSLIANPDQIAGSVDKVDRATLVADLEDNGDETFNATHFIVIR